MLKIDSLPNPSAEMPTVSSIQTSVKTHNNTRSITSKILPAILAITPALSTIATTATTTTSIASAQEEKSHTKDNNAFQISPIWSKSSPTPNGASMQYEHSWDVTNKLTLDLAPAEMGGVRTAAELNPEDVKFKLWAGPLIGTSYHPTENVSILFRTGPRFYLYGYYPKDADANSNVYLESSWGMGFQLGVRYKLPYGLFIGAAYTPDWPAGGEPDTIKPGLSLDIDKGMDIYKETGDLHSIQMDDVINYDEIGHVDFRNGKWHHAIAISIGGTF